MAGLPGLKMARGRKLLTQVELAARAGVSETTINRLENDTADARFSTIRKLAAALGVDPAVLMRPPSSSAS
ncbi:MAG TPA: helix-turn-helix transcriptional regulator [Chloroflexota bacterium]|nr:helix-turn-helix transcriptional regulator [Chloroflexota bacterium]